MAIQSNIGQRIKNLREKVGVSQEKLAQVLGVSRPTISQIEKAERKIYVEELVKLAKFFNLSTDNLLNLEKEPEVIIGDRSEPSPAQPTPRIDVPQKNIDKFREVLLYILNKVGSKANIGETVLYKILYFIDFDFYEKYEEQLIGATYIKNHYGPTPVEFRKLIEGMIRGGLVEQVKSSYFSYPQTKYLPRRPADLKKFQGHEIDVIDEVLNRLSDMNAAQISEYSHQDVPWLTAAEGSAIQYESVFYRMPPYSVRQDLEDEE